MINMGQKAKSASEVLALATKDTKNAALMASATFIRQQKEIILAANKDDMDAAKKRDLSEAMLDRLFLDETRIEAMANSIEDIAKLPDPIGDILEVKERPNGLKI